MKKESGNNRWFVMVVFIMLASLLLPSGGNFFKGGAAGSGNADSGGAASQNAGPGGETGAGDGTSEEEKPVTMVMVGVGNVGEDAWDVTGSGVIWEIGEDDLWIVTAGHVTDTADADAGRRILVNFGEETVEDCQHHGFCPGTDLAFLRIAREDVTESLWSRLRAAETDKASYDALKAADEVRALGFNEGRLLNCRGELAESWIYVEDFAQHMMLAQCVIYPGMSGGGLFDGDGRLIGIVCGGNEQGELAAVPLHVAQARFADL